MMPHNPARHGVAHDDRVLREITEICGSGSARPATPKDRFAGVAPRWVATPGEICAVVKLMGLAARRGLTLGVRGNGSKLDWCEAPERVDLVVETAGLRGITVRPADSGAPGERPTVEVGAGASVRAVQAHLARYGMRIAIDPASPDATIGGVVASGESGPLRHAYGTARELVTGMTVVCVDGVVDQAEGAEMTAQGLGSALCGSYGTLGVITTATLRPEPVPPARVWVVRTVASPLDVPDLVGELLGAQIGPAAVEVDLPSGSGGTLWPRWSRGLRVEGGATRGRPGMLAVLLEGEPAVVAARAEATLGLLGQDAEIRRTAPPWWRRYPFTPGDIALKLAVPITDLHSAVYALRDSAGVPVPVRGGAGVGVVHAALPAATCPEKVGRVLDAVRGVLLARGGSCVVLAAPPAVRAAVDPYGDLPDRVWLQRLKTRLDPCRRLAPGRLF